MAGSWLRISVIGAMGQGDPTLRQRDQQRDCGWRRRRSRSAGQPGDDGRRPPARSPGRGPRSARPAAAVGTAAAGLALLVARRSTLASAIRRRWPAETHWPSSPSAVDIGSGVRHSAQARATLASSAAGIAEPHLGGDRGLTGRPAVGAARPTSRRHASGSRSREQSCRAPKEISPDARGPRTPAAARVRCSCRPRSCPASATSSPGAIVEVDVVRGPASVTAGVAGRSRP